MVLASDNSSRSIFSVSIYCTVAFFMMLTSITALRLRTIAPSLVVGRRLLMTKGLHSTRSVTRLASTPTTTGVPMHQSKQRLPVTTIQTKEEAKKALEILYKNPQAIWACDTEVVNIDIHEQGPVGNGKVICASVYGGEDINFGNGPTLWIENAGPAENILQEFKGWFEDNEMKKVWHNYGFDRHVMENEGILCRGFAGDTMHMARLWDTSRDKATGGGDGYSLESLTELFLQHDPRFVKTSMKDLFGVAKVKKDGAASKVKVIPDLMELQYNTQFRHDWIDYSARDALATWWVRHELENQLKKMPWVIDGELKGTMYDFYHQYWRDFGELLTDMERNGIKVDTKHHLHQAEIRAREERQRMETMFMDWVNEICAKQNQTTGTDMTTTTPNLAKYLNIASTAQLQQLLFGHYENFQLISKTRSFKIDKEEEEIKSDQEQALSKNPYSLSTAIELKQKCKEYGLKVSGSKSDLMNRLLFFEQMKTQFSSCEIYSIEKIIEMNMSRGLPIEGTREELIHAYVKNEVNAKKSFDGLLTTSTSSGAAVPPSIGLNGVQESQKSPEVSTNESNTKKYREVIIETIGLTPKDFTPTGIPQVSASVLKKLAGKNIFSEDPVWGDALAAFDNKEEGKKACRALGALAAVGQIDTTINNFLVPLQALVDKNSRIHCSLNLNTETGRLSSRRPNLQNQPALEKDQYKIRDAFVAEEGHTLIVADYGQLELRILAHITKCQSMIQAFQQGGCFHSRTAVGMYDYIKGAVDSGQVLLEWDYSKGQPTVPLVKDTYGSERRKAKTLNFSIAYGKTVHGLAQDWGITKEEAENTLNAWYRDRPEVKEWQQQTQYLAKRAGYVRTIMGRYRRLPEASSRGPAAGHAMRAAINTPIQGSAADVVMMAMLKLWKSEILKQLGWKLLLQIHDEVILEGPKETRDEAMKEVRSCMENPFDGFGLSKLLVHLDVDAKSADSWYKAK